MKKQNFGFLGGVGIGLGVMYFLDPARGGRRRAGIRDRIVHFSHILRNGIDITSRDLLHRTQGFIAVTRNSMRNENVDDDILIERVRSKLGRIVSHPHAIQVEARNGIVKVSGVILHHELKALILAIERVHGVQGIQNELEPHKRTENIPSLQGGSPKPGEKLDIFQSNWAPSTRFLVGLGGSALLFSGMRNRGISGTVLGVFGISLVSRAITNLEMRGLFGIGARRPLLIKKTINVAAPADRVYDFWLNFENFPRFMTDVIDVRLLGAEQSRWTIEGPAGAPIGWDAIVTRTIPNELIAWKSLPGSVIQNAGRVRFRPNETGGTRIELDFSYNPPAGKLGEVAARIFGSDPKSKLDEALAQMKTLIEEGPSKRQIVGFH